MADSDLIRGNVDTIILKVLYEGDRYGYDLIKQINARSDGQWEIKQPTVYACLKRLEKQGFVSSYWDSSDSDGGRRKYYTLTDSGKEVFLRYKSEFERANALFGELIIGSEPTVFLHGEDDFSDVEDESYSVPKRRRPRPRRVRSREAKQDIEVAPSDKNAEENLDKIEEVEKIENIETGNVTAQNAPIQNEIPANAENIQAAEPVQTEQTPPAPEYVPPAEPQPAPAQFEQIYREEREVPPARATLDPRSIIDSYYAAEQGESYAVARQNRRVQESVPTERKEPVQAKPQQPAPTQAIPSAPTPEAPQVARPARPAANEVAPISDNKQVAPVGFMGLEESLARKEYKSVLAGLVEQFEVAPPVVRAPGEENAAVEEAQPVETVPQGLYRVRQATLDLGNDVQIREHNDSTKQYTHRFYYYSNRLMMTHYTIMCATMFVLGLIMFLTFYVGLGMRMKYDYVLYMAAGLLPIAMFVTAVICFAADPDKTKRANVNFRTAIITRIVIMIQVAVVTYCLNIIWGMPISFSVKYLPSLIIPVVYAVFIPLSEVVYMALLRSERYAAADYELV